MQKGIWIGIGAVLVVVLLVGGYFMMRGRSLAPTSSPTPQNETQQSTSEETVSESDEGVVEITIEGGEFSYSPSDFKVKAGQKVNITFKNVGEMEHDLVIEELGVRTKVIESGEEDTLEFVAPEPGTLTYYCSVGAHRANGMEGTITVE